MSDLAVAVVFWALIFGPIFAVFWAATRIAEMR